MLVTIKRILWVTIFQPPPPSPTHPHTHIHRNLLAFMHTGVWKCFSRPFWWWWWGGGGSRTSQPQSHTHTLMSSRIHTLNTHPGFLWWKDEWPRMTLDAFVCGIDRGMIHDNGTQMPKDVRDKLAPEERKLLWALTSNLPFSKGGFSETVPFWSWTADTLYTPARTVCTGLAVQRKMVPHATMLARPTLITPPARALRCGVLPTRLLGFKPTAHCTGWWWGVLVVRRNLRRSERGQTLWVGNHRNDVVARIGCS